MYYYILNPSAGNSAINPIQDKLRSRLDELGIGGEFAKTTGPGDATKMAASAIAKGFNTIVAVGGDGTVNEIINGITRDKIAVGIIPIGHTNKLAAHLGIGNWQQACEVLAARRLIGYNLMAAGSQYFLSECIISALPLGNAATDAASCRLQVDDKYSFESPFSNLKIINQKFDNPHLDNKLMIDVSEVMPDKSLISRFFKVGRKAPCLTSSHLRASRIVVETTPSLPAKLDGKESAKSTPLSVKLTDRQIRFISEKLS